MVSLSPSECCGFTGMSRVTKMSEDVASGSPVASRKRGLWVVYCNSD